MINGFQLSMAGKQGERYDAAHARLPTPSSLWRRTISWTKTIRCEREEQQMFFRHANLACTLKARVREGTFARPTFPPGRAKPWTQ